MSVFGLTRPMPVSLIDPVQELFLEDVGDGSHEPAQPTARNQVDGAAETAWSTPPRRRAAAEAESDVLQTMSRMIYSGSYALAYGVVYATVFVAQLLPQENPVMHGFHDGGQSGHGRAEPELICGDGVRQCRNGVAGDRGSDHA